MSFLVKSCADTGWKSAVMPQVLSNTMELAWACEPSSQCIWWLAHKYVQGRARQEWIIRMYTTQHMNTWFIILSNLKKTLITFIFCFLHSQVSMLQKKIQQPNQHLSVASKSSEEKLLSLLLLSLTKRFRVQKYQQKKENQLSKRRADLMKPLMDQNNDHLRRLKSTLHSLNAYSRQQGNSLKELMRLAREMEKVLKRAAAIVSAKDDVR